MVDWICFQMVAVNDPSQIKNLRNDWRTKVYIRTFHMFPKRILNARERKELIRLRHMRHPNINRLWLTPVRLDRIVLVSEFCANRSLWVRKLPSCVCRLCPGFLTVFIATRTFYWREIVACPINTLFHL